MTYTVTCVQCDLRREMDELENVLDFQEAHRAEYGEQHVVEFKLIQ